MNKSPLSEKEFEIINIIADGFRSNQRQLSSHIGLSLGMTNLLLRRLATKGYLRIRQLDQKKVEYLLTPRGLAEKAQKTYHYTLKTIQSMTLIQGEIDAILKKNLTPAIKNILIVGRGDLADFVFLTLQRLDQTQYSIRRDSLIPSLISSDTLVLDASIDSVNGDNGEGHVVHLLQTLSNNLNFRMTSHVEVPARG